MEPLDLTYRPPRAPKEQLAGLYMLPRTIDKIRASLPGGNPGQYWIKGFSQRLLDALGIQLDDITAVVALAQSDEEVGAWVVRHSDPSGYGEINEAMVTRSYANASPDRREYMHGIYGPDIAQYETLFDMIEADDRKSFAQTQ